LTGRKFGGTPIIEAVDASFAGGRLDETGNGPQQCGLPQPLGPRRAMNSPLRISSDTPAKPSPCHIV
jgi:hypothetical protein